VSSKTSPGLFRSFEEPGPEGPGSFSLVRTTGMFIDQARIVIQAGNGGHGCIAFRREKFVPRGGPSGGDGGKGGNVYLISDPHENNLLQFRYRRIFRAERGRHGEGSDRQGRSGDDQVIRVPVGTLVYDDETGALLHDFDRPEERWLGASGGRGGKGNARFASAVNRAPRKAEDGAAGEERKLRLELKLLADVGLVGFPNAGKSTLISSLSAAHPKIAAYPFTTLEPSLGVVAADDFQSFVVADIPGLIEGAHEGHGLGLRFLRHIERTRLLLYLIDVSVGEERDPVEQLIVLREELTQHDPQLARKASLVVASKIDSADPTRLEALAQWCGQQNADFARISSVTGEGLDNLKRTVVQMLAGGS
jgi:GTP-binding protein